MSNGSSNLHAFVFLFLRGGQESNTGISLMQIHFSNEILDPFQGEMLYPPLPPFLAIRQI